MDDLFRLPDEGGDDPPGFVGRLRREVLVMPTVVLTGAGVEVAEEKIVMYSEVAIKGRSDLQLQIAGQRPGNFSSMACNRLKADEQESFPEPVRDRDKVYLQEKAAILAAYDPHPLEEPTTVALGKYHRPDQIPPFFWSPAFQALIRKQRLLRCFRCVSESYCLIQVFGVGVTGRVFSEGSNSGRMIVIEAYSHWNSERHVVLLPFVELRQLLLETGHEALFKPGRKDELVRKLVDGLVFRYTVTAQPLPHTGEKKEAGGGKVEGGDGEEKMEAGGGKGKRGEKAEEGEEEEKKELEPEAEPAFEPSVLVRTITHIAPLDLPLPYPQTISALIRLHAHTTLVGDKKFFVPEAPPFTASTQGVHQYPLLELPALTQELVLSDVFSRPSAAAIRRERIEAEAREAARIEAERLAAWLAIPRRKRGFITSRCLRVGPRLFVLSAYIFPTRSTSVVVKAHMAGFCHMKRRRMQQMLSLSVLQALFNITDKADTWSKEETKEIVCRAVAAIRGVALDPHEGVLCLAFGTQSTGDFDFPQLPSTNPNVDIPKLRVPRLRRSIADNRSITCSLDGHIALFAEHSHSSLSATLMRDRRPGAPAAASAPSSSSSSSSLSSSSPTFSCPCPRRMLGVARRLCSGAGRVWGVPCHFVLRQVSRVQRPPAGASRTSIDSVTPASFGWTEEALGTLADREQRSRVLWLTVAEGEAEASLAATREQDERRGREEQEERQRREEENALLQERIKTERDAREQRELKAVQSVFAWQYAETGWALADEAEEKEEVEADPDGAKGLKGAAEEAGATVEVTLDAASAGEAQAAAGEDEEGRGKGGPRVTFGDTEVVQLEVVEGERESNSVEIKDGGKEMKDVDDFGDDDDDDDDDEEEEEEEVALPPHPRLQAQSAYTGFAEGFEAEMELYLPFGAEGLPEGCRLTCTLSREALFELAPHQATLVRALMVHYLQWHEAADEASMAEMEGLWSRVARGLVRRLVWVLREGPVETESVFPEGSQEEETEGVVPSPDPANLLAPDPDPNTDAPAPAPAPAAPKAPDEPDEDDSWIVQANLEEAHLRAQTPEERQAAEREAAIAAAAITLVDGAEWAHACRREAAQRGELGFDGARPARRGDVTLPLPLPTVPGQHPPLHLILAFPRCSIFRRALKLPAPKPFKALVVTVEVYLRGNHLGIVAFNTRRSSSADRTLLQETYLGDFPLVEERRIVKEARLGDAEDLVGDALLALKFRHIVAVEVAGGEGDGGERLRLLELTFDYDATQDEEEEEGGKGGDVL